VLHALGEVEVLLREIPRGAVSADPRDDARTIDA
jgi:hypothetical protein